jgi:hypothetical protein
MNKTTPGHAFRRFRTPVALLLAYLTFLSPLAPVFAQTARVARTDAPARQGRQGEVTQPARGVTTTGTQGLTQPAPKSVGVAAITATKVDAYPSSPNPANPGETITYTVTVTNTGTADATNVVFNDTIDPNTTFVPGSLNTQPIAVDDAYNVIGNVRIQPNAAQGLLANDRDPDTGNNTGLTASGPTTSTQGGNLTINADGSFSYNPAPGFAGTDTFTYTITDAGGKTDTAVATLSVGNGTATPGTNVVWFVDPNAASGGDGRLTNPFNCYTGGTASCFSQTAADDPGDAIFLFSGAHTGGYALLANQKLIGAGAGDTLANIDALTVPAYSDALPTTGGASPTITTTNVNAIPVSAGGILLRGFTVGNTGTGTKISGSSFGTLTVGNSTTPDVTLNGTGKALDLTTGALAATSAFASVTTTSSATQGISLAGVTGTVAFGSTTVSGSTTQGILVGTTTANVNFGNTSVTGGTDAISLQNNSAGTRTFGTISVTTPSATGFLHGAGGGAVSAGATTITNPTGTGIDIQNSTTLVSFGATTVNKGTTAGTGVNLSTDSNGITFGSLAVTTSNGAGLTTSSAATVTVSSASGSSISATGVGTTVAHAISATSTTFSAAFTSLASTNSGGTGTGITLTGSGGTLTSTTTNIQNPGGIGISVGTSVAASTFNFGNTTVSASGGTGVNLTSNVGALTFADLDITPDAGQIALNATNNTGTITTTSGDIASTTNIALNITGASSAARTPLAMVLNNVDSTNSATTGVNLNFVSGNLTVNDPGVATNISNPTGVGIQVQNTASGTMNFGNTSVTGSGGTSIVLGTASNGNAGNVTFAALNIGPDSGQRALLATQNTGTITTTSGTITAVNNTAVEIVGVSAGSRTPLNMALTKVSATASGGNPPNGIVLTNVNGPAANVGFVVNGDGTNTTKGGNATGGTIANTSGADGATTGIGIRLENADKVTLRRMQLNDHSNFAIRAFTSSNFTMEYSTINGTNGTNASFDDGSAFFTDTTGTVTFTSCILAGGWEDTIRALNSTAVTLTNFIIDTCDVSQTATTEGNDAIGFDGGISGAVMTLTLKNSNITAAKGDLLDVLNTFGATTTASIKNNHFSNNHSAIVAAGGGVALTPNGTMKLDVDTNTFRDAVGNALFVNASGDAGAQQADVEGYIRNNTIGVAAIANSGSTSATGIEIESNGGGDLDALVVSNNQVFQYNNHGIRLSFGDRQTKPVTINVTVDGNTVNTPGTLNTDFNGFHLNNGVTSTPAPGDDFTDCIDIKNNNFTGGGKGTTPPNNGDVRLRQRITTTVQLPGYTGANSDNTAVITYLRTAGGGGIKNNSFGTGAAANTVSTGGGGYVNTPGGAPCAQPSFANLPSQPVELQTPPQAEQQSAPTFQGVTSQPFVAMPQAAKPAKGTAQALAVAQLSAPPQAPVSKTEGGAKSSSTRSAQDFIPTPPGPTVSVNIGTLKPGDSVTITFQVTINLAIPSNVSSVSNQGTVTADGGINVLTDDPSVVGANNPTVTPVLTPPDIKVNDAKTPEPTSGTSTMLFTVTLNHSYPSPVTVNYATADGGANPALGGAACGDPNVDYLTASGTVNFAAGQTVQTVPVTVCSDANNAETDENFLVNISGNNTGNIVDAQAVGTITVANTPGTLLISELRTSGPGSGGSGDPNDDFVELYNNTNSPLTVAASDASSGYGVYKSASACTDTPVLVGVVPNGVVIPAHGHYLLTGSGYSLQNYGGTNAALGNANLSATATSPDIEADRNVAVFSTSDVAGVSSANRLDAVGFTPGNTGGNCDLLREGTNLAGATGAISQYSFVRDLTTGFSKDTNDNSADLFVVSTTPSVAVGANATPRLGAPGPENLSSPVLKLNSQIQSVLISPGLPDSSAPNRTRDASSYTDTLTPSAPNGGVPASNPYTLGTLSIQRRFINQTGAPVTRLRFRVVSMTAGVNNPNLNLGGAQADIRLLSSNGTTRAPVVAGVTFRGLTLEQTPTQALGGGWNSTVTVNLAALPGGNLGTGQSVDVQFLLGVATGGKFAFFVIVEGLP